MYIQRVDYINSFCLNCEQCNPKLVKTFNSAATCCPKFHPSAAETSNYEHTMNNAIVLLLKFLTKSPQKEGYTIPLSVTFLLPFLLQFYLAQFFRLSFSLLSLPSQCACQRVLHTFRSL